MFVLLMINEIILQSSVILLSDKHIYLDLAYLAVVRYYMLRLSTSTNIR
jgi:hypothetical protein